MPRCEPQDDPDRGDEQLLTLVPSDTKKSYDMRKILR